jgi:phosphohistidine phosphatase SixA
MKKLLLLLLIIGLFITKLSAQTTKIWVVRHAEKEVSDPENKDPELTEKGLVRAWDLNTFLKKENITQLYSTNFFRTRQTLQPLASTYNLDIAFYKDNASLVNKIKSLKGDQNIVVAGHSNTVIKLVKELGAQIAIDTLTEDDYDYIFLVTIKGDKVSLKTKHFGAKHHVTKL